MNILFTICARAGSKGVKGKNTCLFCGMPLIYYTAAAFELYQEAYAGMDASGLALNTDSSLLTEQMRQTGVPFLSVGRKLSLAGDMAAKKDVIKDTLIQAENRGHCRYDLIVDLDLTSPLRTAADIDGTIRALKGDEHADISYSVTHARRSPYFNMVTEDENGYCHTVIKSDFVARQQAPVCYDMNASIYAYRRDYLLSSRLYDRKAVIWMMPDTGFLDIDSDNDLKWMEVIADHLFTNHIRYQAIRLKAQAYQDVRGTD